MTAKCDNCNERIPLPPSLAGKTVSCPHCHKPTKLVALSTKCPSCASSDTIQCSMVWKAGTSKSKISGLGMDLTGDVGGFVGTQTSQTILASSLAPPARPVSKNHGASLVALGIFGTALGFAGLAMLGIDDIPKWLILIVCPVAIIGGIAAASRGSNLSTIEKKRVADEYSSMIEIYMRQWVCQRCGSKFEV